MSKVSKEKKKLFKKIRQVGGGRVNLPPPTPTPKHNRVKDNTYIDFEKEVNDKDTNFKVGDYVRIPKYKSIFAKGYPPNWSEEVFVIKKVKNTVPWAYVINNLNGEEIIGTFYEKELQRKKMW